MAAGALAMLTSSCVRTPEPPCFPAGARRQLIGVSDPAYIDRIGAAEVLIRLHDSDQLVAEHGFSALRGPIRRFQHDVGSNQTMKPTAPSRSNFRVLATTPCRGLSYSR